jgi:hypothetical protein
MKSGISAGEQRPGGTLALVELTPAQQVVLWLVAAAVGLGLAQATNAGTWGSIGLVAGVGILLGIGVAAWQAQGRRSDRS